MHAVANQSAANQAALFARYNCLPGSVGWGVNVATGTLTGLPIVQLTYNDSDKTYGAFTVPAQAIITPYPAAGQGVVTSAVYQTFGDLETKREAMAAANEGQAGALFGNGGGLANVLKQFPSANAHTAVRDAFPTYTLTLPVNPVTKRYTATIDEYLKYVVDALPPSPYTAEMAPALQAVVERPSDFCRLELALFFKVRTQHISQLRPRCSCF